MADSDSGEEMMMEEPTGKRRAPLPQSPAKAAEGSHEEADAANQSSPSGRQEEVQNAKPAESTSTKQGVLKGGKLAKGGVEAETGSQKKSSTGRKKITWVNLPDKVPTAEDKPSRAPTVRAKAADVLSTFPRAAVPNAARVMPRIRSSSRQAKAGSSQGRSRTGEEGPAAPQPKTGVAAPGPKGLSSSGRTGATEPGLSKKAKDADDEVLAYKLAAAARLSEKPAISMEFSTFKPSAVLRQQS